MMQPMMVIRFYSYSSFVLSLNKSYGYNSNHIYIYKGVVSCRRVCVCVRVCSVFLIGERFSPNVISVL